MCRSEITQDGKTMFNHWVVANGGSTRRVTNIRGHISPNLLVFHSCFAPSKLFYKYTKHTKAEQTVIAGRAGYREDVIFILKRLLTLIGAAAHRGDEESVVFYISVPAVSHTLSKNPISYPYFNTTDGIRIPNLKNLRKKKGRCWIDSLYDCMTQLFQNRRVSGTK
jgi:hypothetical protein